MPLAAGDAYVGAWVNHRYGYVRGATLTLTTPNATVLISVLVMLVGWAGIAAWELVCFILHLFRSTSRARDGLYHQQQVLLRGQSPAFNSVLRMFGLAVAWRSNTRGSFLRSLPIILLALSSLALFAVAPVFVSKITNPDGEVLAQGKCGFIMDALEGGLYQGENATKRLIGNVLYQAGYTSYREESNYARSCYGTQLDRSVASCNIYNRPIIPSVRSDDAPCPFAEKACLEKNAVSFDTGLFSSELLGINVRQSDQIHMRKKMTCVPVAVDNYTTGWTTERKPTLPYAYISPPPGETYRYYNLGQGLSDGQIQSDYAFYITNSSVTAQAQAYRLEYSTYYPGSLNRSSIVPVPDFDQKIGDLTFILLSNVAGYTDPVEDTWFKATTRGDAALGLEYMFLPDDPITVMGCIDQYQFCNGEDRCGPLGSTEQVFEAVLDIGYNKLQTATLDLVKAYLSFMETSLVLQFLRNEILLASQNTYGAFVLSSALQPDQWRTEMANLFNVSLAGLQAHGVLHAAPGNSEFKPGVKLHDFIVPETTPEHLKLCESQKFRNAAYSSVSLLGLILVVVVSFIIISLNMVLPGLVKMFQGKWNGAGAGAKRAWIEDDVLHLQRIALEARGMGPWKGRISAVPVLEGYGTEFQMGSFEGGYAEQVPLHEAHVMNDGHVPSQQWDTKGVPQYNQRPM